MRKMQGKINNEKSKRMAKINKANNIKSQRGFSLIIGQSRKWYYHF